MPRRHSGSAAILAALQLVPSSCSIGRRLVVPATTKDSGPQAASVESASRPESLSAPAPGAVSHTAAARPGGRKLPTGAAREGTHGGPVLHAGRTA